MSRSLLTEPPESAAAPSPHSIAVLGELHRFVPVDRVIEFVRLGWLPLPTLAGTHHGEFKVHVVWLCCCGAKEPDPHTARALARASIRASKEREFRHRQIAAGRGKR